MNAKVPGAQLHEAVDGPRHLIFGHAVFGIPGHIHNGVAQAEGAAGIISQAHRLRHRPQSLQEIHIGGIVQIDIGSHFFCLAHVLFRCHIGGKHDILAGNAHSLGQQQLRIGGAVAAAALLVEDLQNVGVGGCLYGKKLLKPLVPGKGSLQGPGISADTGLVVQVERRRDLGNDLLRLVQGDKWDLFHAVSSSLPEKANFF